MLNRFKQWISKFKLLHQDIELTNIIRSVCIQEDPATKATIKRVRKAFEQQSERMNHNAMRPHSALCKDPVTCPKRRCFIVGDKIVSKPYEVELKRKVDESMGDFQSGDFKKD